ncbi:MAG: T9SS type A sorting domain-containing protein [Taibaiella sp.]|nr:T9SS type A sorting domain-containing protein [Taibaiella sp.]
MRKTFTLIALLFMGLGLSAQTLPNVDLSFELAHPPQAGAAYVIPYGDSLQVSFKITNHGTDDLDTSDYILYGIDMLPPGYALVATDSLTGEKVYLQPGDSFIAGGILFGNTDSLSTEDFTNEYCFYLLHDFVDSLFYTDTNALNDTVCFSITYLKNPDAVSIAGDHPEANSIRLYPNPVVKDLRMDFPRPLSKTHTFIVTNMLGQEVYRADIASGRSAYIYDAGNLPGGIYNVQVKGAEVNIKKKWMKQ